jgi:hypothetical protein
MKREMTVHDIRAPRTHLHRVLVLELWMRWYSRITLALLRSREVTYRISVAYCNCWISKRFWGVMSVMILPLPLSRLIHIKAV